MASIRTHQQLGQSGTPAFHRLMSEGAYTLNARTVREKTSTLPNHTAMLTGRRVDSKHGGHGYSENFDNGATVHNAAGHYVASVFDVVHDHGGSTALFAAKTKFKLYKRSWNTKGAPTASDPMTDVPRSIDSQLITTTLVLSPNWKPSCATNRESSPSWTFRYRIVPDMLTASWARSTSRPSNALMCSSVAC